MSFKPIAVAATVALILAGPSAMGADGSSAEISEDNFIGYWWLGSPDECIDRDTLAFYVTGVFAVTNGGGNPVEALGIWKLEGDTMSLNFTELDDPRQEETIEAAISGNQANEFTLTAPDLPDGEVTLYRCEY